MPIRTMLLGAAVFALSCGANRSAPPVASSPVDDRSLLVGTWTTSTASYDAAGKETHAVRLSSAGALEHGTWEGGRFVPAAAAGPSGASFVARFELDPASHTITYLLDGAEEHARYSIDGPDRFKTESGPPDSVTVFHARRR